MSSGWSPFLSSSSADRPIDQVVKLASFHITW